MKITTNYEPTAGTVTVVMAMNEQADHDAMADLAWRAVYHALETAERRRGTIPAGLREPGPPSMEEDPRGEHHGGAGHLG